MGEDPGTGSAGVTGTQEPEQIQQEIERTREAVGDTVEALAQKADVKSQAKRKLQEAKASVSEKTEGLVGKAREASPNNATAAASQVSERARENPLPMAAASAFAVGFLVGRISKR
jgi:ElaB/YqjD/DUF883 family membrane-anchored ribosome-binding protein